MDEKTSRTFAGLLKRYRSAISLTQEALAERASLSARGVADLESGRRSRPRRDTVQRLAVALGLTGHQRAVFYAAADVHDPTRPTSPWPLDLTPGAEAPSILVGRGDEVALVERHLSGGGPPALLLAGEPGIGKTRMLHEAAVRAGGSGWRVLWGGCRRRGEQEPYGPLLDALDRHLRGRSPTQGRADLRGCAWLVRLLPELADGLVDLPPSEMAAAPQEKRLVYRAVRQFLSNAAGPRGTLLLLDDLQWATPDTLDLLATLLGADAAAPLRVIGVYRDTEVALGHPLSSALADLAHAHLATHHVLAPLSREEVGQLLDSLLDSREGDRALLRERMMQRSGGVPYFVVSCVQGLRQDHTGCDADTAVPWDVAQSIRQRVAVLPQAAREILDTAAVMGRVVPRAILLRAVPHAEDIVVSALAQIRRARLLVDASEETYQFAHDVVREVVEADLDAGCRMALHRQVANAVKRSRGSRNGEEELPVELLAYHYAGAGAWDEAVLYLEQAGDRAWERIAYVAARDYYTALVDRLDSLGRALDAARAREKLGTVLDAVGQHDAALAPLERAASAYHAAGDVEGLGRVVAQVAWVHAAQGTVEGMVERIRPVLYALDARGPSPGLAALGGALAFLHYMGGRYDEHLAVAERSTAIARALGDSDLLAGTEKTRGMALLTIGRFAEALSVMGEVMRLAEAANNVVALRASLAVTASVHERRGEFGLSEQYLERVQTVVERQGDLEAGANLRSSHARVVFYRGDWADARSYLKQALALSRLAGGDRERITPLLESGRLCLAAGSWDEAERYLDESIALADRCGDRPALWFAHSLRAEYDVRSGHAHAARTRLGPLLDGHGLSEWGVRDAASILAWACLECGDVDDAEALVTCGIARARAEDDRLMLVDFSRIQAMVLARRGRWEDAVQTVEEGLALARAMPYPYAEAQLLHVSGMAYARQGKLDVARGRLEAGLTIVQRLGARKEIERMRRSLTALTLQRRKDARDRDRRPVGTER